MITPFQTPAAPERVLQHAYGFALTRILATAVELRIFDRIHAGCTHSRDLIRQTAASERGLRTLLDALVALGYVTRESDQYALTPEAAAYLTRDSPRYLGGYVDAIAQLFWPAWPR